MAEWSYFSNHGHVLVLLARQPDSRLRDLAAQIGITERAVHRLVSDLEAGGALVRKRCGRRTEYVIDFEKPLRHPIERHRTIGDFVRMIWGKKLNKHPSLLPPQESRLSPGANGTDG